MGPFATATELCERIQINLPDDLARLQSILDDASAEIRGFTGQVLSQVLNEQVTFPRWSSTLLVLPERPVTGVDSVVVDAVTIPTTDYAWTRGGHIWRLDGKTWSTPATGITSVTATVQYDHGYAELTPEFERIKAICVKVAARAFTQNEETRSELGVALTPGAGYSPEIFLTPDEQFRLSDYGASVMA